MRNAGGERKREIEVAMRGIWRHARSGSLISGGRASMHTDAKTESISQHSLCYPRDFIKIQYRQFLISLPFIKNIKNIYIGCESLQPLPTKLLHYFWLVFYLFVVSCIDCGSHVSTQTSHLWFFRKATSASTSSSSGSSASPT